ncbi:hypothetical protein [Winogradskyella flava]|nr:hypothetical protein [Winogradskyella flava]
MKTRDYLQATLERLSWRRFRKATAKPAIAQQQIKPKITDEDTFMFI